MKTWMLAGGVFVAVFSVAFALLSLKPGSSPSGEPQKLTADATVKPGVRDNRTDAQRTDDNELNKARVVSLAIQVIQKRYPDLDIPRIMSKAPNLQGYAYMAEVSAPKGFARDSYKGMTLGCFAARSQSEVEHAVFAHDTERFMKVTGTDELSAWIDSGCAAAIDDSPATVSPVQSAQLVMSWMPQTSEYASERQELMKRIQQARR